MKTLIDLFNYKWMDQDGVEQGAFGPPIVVCTKQLSFYKLLCPLLLILYLN